jgi:hypothetical protein
MKIIHSGKRGRGAERSFTFFDVFKSQNQNLSFRSNSNGLFNFSGIMFPIKAKKDLPVHQLIINSVAVRGQLGPMTVWVSNRDAGTGATANGQQEHNQRNQYEFPLHSRHWTQIFKADVKPSRREYATLDLSSNPIVLNPGEVRAIYVHSASPGDEGVVYDNSSIHPRQWHRHGQRMNNNNPLRAEPRYQDGFLAIHSARAHLSPRPFGQSPIWGWGNAWREHREFVGRLNYGVVYQLWNPEIHSRYFSTTRTSALTRPQHQHHGVSSPFGEAVLAILACQRRWESPWSKLPDECIYYVLNMCRYDWFGDSPEQLKAYRRLRARRLRQLEAQARQAREEQAVEVERQEALVPHETGTAAVILPLSQHHQQQQEVEEMFVDAQEEEQPGEVHVVDDDGVNGDDDDDDDQADDSDAADSDVVMSEEEVDDEDSANEDDDDDDEEESEVEEEDEVAAGDGDEDDDSDTREWHRAHGYHPPHAVFAYEDISSDEEDNDGQEGEAEVEDGRPEWIQRHFARVSLLRAMAGGRGNP